ncbi:hypothetical protein [Streptomyces sp. AC1-42T]|uniref:hypothetical protein n=1 Tax=Streptomyces sp. AC1-42T TaxID=2218665 RepID=UPI000DAD9C2B|nr:hypothetical protein [Streptomyces sp. AC1-42T]PZT71498.1 hypothetical protein DNK55_32830 [Streptomyces sp. AC1-42T]
MTLAQAPLLTNGATHSAQTFRMMIRDLARGSEGVTEGNDLKVTPLTVPAGGVLVGDGSGIVRGRAAAWQGHYTAYNIGTAPVNIAPTGATARTDMVLLRVLDPEYEGNRDPASDPVVFFDVASGVSSTATAPPAGYSAIPLARINMPANTGTITAAMITDLRRICNPRKDRTLYSAFPGAASDLTYSDNKWHNWPAAAGWNISVPSWAVSAKVMVTIAGLRMTKADVYAKMQTVLGTGSAAVLGEDTFIDDDQGTGTRRNTVVLGDNLGVPTAMRGTTQRLALQTYMYKSPTGDLRVDAGTSIFADVEFTEGIV